MLSWSSTSDHRKSQHLFIVPPIETSHANYVSLDTRSSTPTKKAPSPHVSEANTLYAATPQARSAASHANSARLSVPRLLSQSRLKSEKMGLDERQDMTST